MKQHYDNIDDYISDREKYESKFRYVSYDIINYDFALKYATSEDDKLVIRTAYLKNISLLKSKLKYKNILDFRVHIMLLQLQKELKHYNLKHDTFAYDWYKIRRINILNKMNQLRVKYDYKESFDI